MTIYRFDDSKLANPYGHALAEPRSHHLVEGEIKGMQTAINMLEEKLVLLHLEYEASIADCNDMTVEEYRAAGLERAR